MKMEDEEDPFISHFSIQLDNPVACYFAGQEVSGVVHLHVNVPLETRGLFIQIRGDCNVHWTEKNSGYKAEPRHLRNYQQCFTWTHFFLGNPRCQVTVPSAAHQFEFKYRLPRKIPSSFEGSHGNIRYYCMAQLDWPGGNHFKQTLQLITINSLFDLNKNPDALMSGEKRTEYKRVWLRSSLKAILSVPRRGFVPGQTVTAHATVDNKTMRSILRVKVEIVEICRYLACEQERRTKRVVAGTRHGPIDRGKKETWFVQMDIPPIPPSGLVYCDIIHLEYYIKLIVESSHLPKQKVQVPLIIGTVPLEDEFDDFSSEEGNDADIAAESLSQQYGRRVPSLKFAESVWGKTELSTAQRRVSQAGISFAPTYVTYQKARNSTGGLSSRSSTSKLRDTSIKLDEVMLEESDDSTG